MPIRYNTTPWIFIPSFSLESKVLLFAEMRSMVQYFTLAYGCPPNSYVWQYEKSVLNEIRLNQDEVDSYLRHHGEIEANHEELLVSLAHTLSTSRQRKYCRDVLNNLALHISDQVRDYGVTQMLNNFIDFQVDDVLRL